MKNPMYNNIDLQIKPNGVIEPKGLMLTIGTINHEFIKEYGQPMLTAVNCTYRANINPEKIQELIEALKSVKMLNLHLYEKGTVGNRVYEEVQQALNNIKYKD